MYIYPLKRQIAFGSLLVTVFFVGLFISSGLLAEWLDRILKVATPLVRNELNSSLVKFEMYPKARHYLLLRPDQYMTFYNHGLSFALLWTICSNAFFNALFQPLFPSILTPQAVFFYLLFPFFIYGALRYFRKVPIILLLLLVMLVVIGAKNSVVGSLTRHRMSCEFLYILIGLAGFTDWITGR